MSFLISLARPITTVMVLLLLQKVVQILTATLAILGRDAERPCMMTYRYDIEATDEDVLYCSSCLQTIATHLTDHHQ